MDETGQFMERGDWAGLSEEAGRNARIENDITGMQTYLGGSEVPNYILREPGAVGYDPIRIYQNSTTVGGPTSLSDLLDPNLGNSVWAACTEFGAH
jgi:hypothetical protein